MKFDIDNFYEIDEILFREQLDIPAGWKEEIYYNDGEISFSSPMTSNSWSDDKHKIGVIESITINEFEGFYQDSEQDTTVQVNGDENIDIDEAIDRIVSNYADDWNIEIKEKLKQRLNIDVL